MKMATLIVHLGTIGILALAFFLGMLLANVIPDSLGHWNFKASAKDNFECHKIGTTESLNTPENKWCLDVFLKHPRFHTIWIFIFFIGLTIGYGTHLWFDHLL